jgi:hypothetical protein
MIYTISIVTLSIRSRTISKLARELDKIANDSSSDINYIILKVRLGGFNARQTLRSVILNGVYPGEQNTAIYHLLVKLNIAIHHLSHKGIYIFQV